MDRRNDWNLAARDKRIEMCGYQIDGGRIGSICGREGHSLQVLRQFRALTIAISRTSSSGSNE